MPGADTELRKLAAIMFTDMVGYSALANRNEARAIELLEEHRRIVRAKLPLHGGREVKTTGDGFLIEFSSALAAVQCAVDIQQALHERNANVPPEKNVQIRIGIHVGDVIPSGGDIHGDGVNIAARLEPLAAPGGICISSAVWEQVRNKVDHPLALLGPAELKNIELPVVVHRVVMPWESAAATATPARRRRSPVIMIVAVAVLALLAVAILLVARKRSGTAPSSEIVLFTTGFESPGYQPGPLVGQQGWTAREGVSPDAAKVVVSGGGQHLQISGDALQRAKSGILSGWFVQPVTNGLPESDAMRVSLNADVQFLPGTAFERPGFTVVMLMLIDQRFSSYAAIGFGKAGKILGQNFAQPNQIVWSKAGAGSLRHLRADLDFTTRTASFMVDGVPFGKVSFNPIATNRPAYAAFVLQTDHPIDSLVQINNLAVTATPVSTNPAAASAP